MNPSNPYAKGAVESSIQRIASQNVQTFGPAPLHRNPRVSTCHDSPLTYDHIVQILVKAIVETNQAL